MIFVDKIIIHITWLKKIYSIKKNNVCLEINFNKISALSINILFAPAGDLQIFEYVELVYGSD